MEKLILTVHVFLAITSLVLAGVVVLKTHKKDFKTAPRLAKNMWYGTLATLISGVLLTAVAHVSIGRLCLSSLTLLVVIYAAHHYERSKQALFLKNQTKSAE